MADNKITELTEDTAPALTDLIATVEDPSGTPVTKKTTLLTLQNLLLSDGWISANGTWTYASASTITVPSGAASKYKVGDKIKWTQTTVKYGVISAVADTVLTIIVNTDYTVANAAITLNYYSHDENPLGFPNDFKYTPTVTGFSSAPSDHTYRYSVHGRTVYLTFDTSTNGGTSDTTGFTFTLPVAAKNGHSQVWFAIRVYDNSAFQAAPGMGTVTSDSTAATLYKDGAAAGWTASNLKTARGELFYFI